MVRIVATEEQMRKIAEARESVEVVDAAGNRLGILARLQDIDDIRIAKQRLASEDQRLPYSALIEHLATLEAAQ